MKQIVKALVAFNLATVIRAVRFGPRDALRRLTKCYYAADPFGQRRLDDLFLALPEASLHEVTRSRPWCGSIAAIPTWKARFRGKTPSPCWPC
jgi:hypothetical protein